MEAKDTEDKGTVDSLGNLLSSLTKRLKQDVERWRGRKLPENVRLDRREKRQQINQLMGIASWFKSKKED